MMAEIEVTPNRTETLKLHPAELKLIMYIRKLKNGSIEELKVSDGLPVSIEQVKEKVRFI